MKNETNFTSETYPWNNEHGLGQHLLKRHMQVVREPINFFTNVPQHLGHDRISFISDIQRRNSNDNSAFLRRFDYPLVNFFSLTNQQSQNWNKITSTKFSPSSKAILHCKQFFSQLGGTDKVPLKYSDLDRSTNQNGTHKKEALFDYSRQINSEKLHFNPGSKSNWTIDKDSVIPGTKAQNLVQAQFIEKQNPGIVEGGRISKTDTMSSGNNTIDQQTEAIFHKVQAYHDKPVEMSDQAIQSNLPQLTTRSRAIYRSYSKLSDNKSQLPVLGRKIVNRKHVTVFRKRFDVTQLPENTLTKMLFLQRPILSTQINLTSVTNPGNPEASGGNEVLVKFSDQQKPLLAGEGRIGKIDSKPGNQLAQQKIPTPRLTSLDRPIYRNFVELSGNKYQSLGFSQQIHSNQHASIFRKRLDAAQVPVSFITKNLLWQEPVAGAKINLTNDTSTGLSDTKVQNEAKGYFFYQQKPFLASEGRIDKTHSESGDQITQQKTPLTRLNSLNRAINRSFIDLSDNKYQTHNIGQKPHSKQHASIFRKQLDAAQIPENSTKILSWKTPVTNTKINSTVDTNIDISGANVQNYIVPIHFTPLNRAVCRNVVELSDNKYKSHGLGHQIHSNQTASIFRKRLDPVHIPESSTTKVTNWEQPIAGTRVNQLVDPSQGVSVVEGHNKVQAQFIDQQIPTQAEHSHIDKIDELPTINKTIGQQHVPTSLNLQATRHDIARSGHQSFQTKVFPFRQNFTDSTGTKNGSGFHFRSGTLVNRSLNINSQIPDAEEQNEGQVKYFENTEQTRINKLLKNNTPFSFIHWQLSPNLIRRLVSTHRFDQYSNKIAKRQVRNDLSNQISSVSLPIDLNGNSIAVQRANPTMIQNKSLLEFDCSSQLPLAGNFNIQRKTKQPVLQNEENTNILFRQDVTDQSPQSLITVTEANSPTDDTKSYEPEAKQPSADELVDKVWRKLMRKLVVEQERIGGSAKWH